MTVAELPSHLNCHRVQADQLTRHRIIQSIAPSEGRSATILNKITLAEIQSFLCRLRAHVKEANEPTEGMLNLTGACEVALANR